MTKTTPTTRRTERSTHYADRENGRYWWHHAGNRTYVPTVYSDLSDQEWELVEAWFEESEAQGGGEMSIPMISVLQGFIMGSGIRSIVQLGHYKGYSTLFIGFMMRRMGIENGFVSIDIDKTVTQTVQDWLKRAELEPYVNLIVNNSADPAMPMAAETILGRAPRCVIIDSSHQYAHTIEELNLWWEALAPGGMLFLHDCSEYARQWDSTKKGGVRQALEEWVPLHPEAGIIMLDGDPHADGPTAYADGCGLCIMQKPMTIVPGAQTNPETD